MRLSSIMVLLLPFSGWWAVSRGVGKPRSTPCERRAAGSPQREVTTLPRVKKCTPSVPWAWESPNSERFQPPKEKYAIGTGIGTLIPTMPTSTSFSNSRAAAPSPVKIAVPLPYWLALIRSRPSR